MKCYGDHIIIRRILGWEVSVNRKLVWCKKPQNNEFRTKKFRNQDFLYGISLFCLCSENRDFLHSKILCFCIFFLEIGVLNTNRTPSGRCLSESVDIFLTCGKKSGWNKHDVCDRRPATWMSPRAVPVRMRYTLSTALQNSHSETDICLRTFCYSGSSVCI